MKISSFCISTAVVACLLLSSCITKNETATVKIKARNLDGRELTYHRSYNGVYLMTFTPVSLDADSTFTLTMPTESAEIVMLLAKDPTGQKPPVIRKFYALPGTTEVTIDPLAQDNATVLPPTGNHLDSEAAPSVDDIYNLWFMLATGRKDAIGLWADSIPADAVSRLNAHVDSILDAYSEASPAVLKALERDARLNALMVFNQCVYLNRNKQNADEWRHAQARLIEETDINNPANALNPFFGDRIASTLFFEETFPDNNFPNDITPDSLLGLKTDYFLKTLSGKAAEATIGTLLYNDGARSTFTPCAPALTERFKSMFPTSGIIPLLDEMAKANNAFNNPPESDDIVFIDNSNIKTLADLLAPYKGKPVFIDIWATWCGPCRESFSHVGPIQQYAADNDVQLLYISIDEQPGIEDQWKRMARYYNLKGHHVLVNPQFKQEIFSTFGTNDILSIPQIAIVDREGNIRVCPQELAENSDFTQLRTLLDEVAHQ